MSKEFREVLECVLVLGVVLLIGHFWGPEIHARTAPLVRSVGSQCRELALVVLAVGGLGCGLAAALTLSASAAITARCGALTARILMLVLLTVLMSVAFYSAIPGFISGLWLLCAGGFLLFSRAVKS